jgi:hypothetical protein
LPAGNIKIRLLMAAVTVLRSAWMRRAADHGALELGTPSLT